MDFPIPPEFWWSTDNLSASIFLQGVDQEILPCGQGRIDSVKINPSLLMMRDCCCQTGVGKGTEASLFWLGTSSEQFLPNVFFQHQLLLLEPSTRFGC